MKDKYYYHITDEKHLPEILKNGLKPMIGENSSLVGETDPTIYLCRHKDVPYWKILLGKTVVLQIKDLNVADDDHCQYHHYDEYLYRETIPAYKIKRVYFPTPSSNVMKNLCLSYISSFNQCAEIAARYYNMHDEEECYDECYEEFDASLNCCLAVTERLDYSVLTTREIRKELREWGDYGAYTFVDRYLDTGKRLYQQLVLYPNDEFEKKRKALHHYIAKTFRGCLDVNIGGWTG